MIKKFKLSRHRLTCEATRDKFSFSTVAAFGMVPDASASRSLYSQIHANSNAFNQGWLRGHVATVTRSVRDIDDDKSKLFSEAFQLHIDCSELIPIRSNNFEIVRPIFQDISPSGKLTISMKLGGKGDDIPLINVCGEETSHYLDVSDYHGKFVGDSWFGGISWSQDERFVAYVAYKKENVDKKAESGKYFEYRNSVDGANKFEYVDDWGEKYVGLVSLSLNVLNTETGEVSTVEGIDDTIWTVGQPVFLPCPEVRYNHEDERYHQKSYRLAYTAWKNGPRKLGMIYCYQRESSIFVVDLNEQLTGRQSIDQASPSVSTSASTSTATSKSDSEVHVLLTRGVKLARSARFSPQGDKMIFLGSKEGFASHNGCSELLSIDVADILKSLNRAKERNKEMNDNITVNEGVVDKMNIEIQEETMKVNTIVPTISGSSSTNTKQSDESFPGIYTDQLPRNCFLNNDYVIMNTPWGSVESMITVEISTKEISKISFPYTNIAIENKDKISTVILDIQKKISPKSSIDDNDEYINDILISISTPSSPQIIGVLNLKIRDGGQSTYSGISTSLKILPKNYKPNLMPITRKKNTKIANIIPTEEIETKNIVGEKERKKIDAIDLSKMLAGSADFNNLLEWKTSRYYDDNGIPYESILMSPKRTQNDDSNFESQSSPSVTKKCPLIVVPHGGPHSCMTTSYVASYVFLALHLGAAILHVNYRGSTGFGRDSINFLLGNIGKSDVADMMSCTMDAIDKNEFIDAERVAVVGGSHGGFLAAHLVGQYPEIFKVACMRNPVTDLPGMLSVTDIPDWCFVEALGPEGALKYSKNKDNNNEDDFNTMPDEEDLIKMRECSPIIYVKNVRAPVLMLIGGKDRRVPMSQGVSYYHNLKAKGVTTKLLVFPEDVHAIDRPLSEAEQWIAIASWLETHLL